MESTTTARVVTVALLLVTSAACHQYLDPRVYRQVRPDLPAEMSQDVLQVRALGVHGFVVRYRDEAVLFPPMFSNPPLDRVAAGNRPLSELHDEVDAHLRAEWLEGVSAVLVGHSHYDHFMDMPYIAQKYLPAATLYGSRTAASILKAFAVPNPIVPVNGWKTGDKDWVDYRSCTKTPKEGCVKGSGAGDWLPQGRPSIRIRALCSRHSSQFLGLPVTSQGCYDDPPAQAPRTANEWKLGDTLAYLVEFLDAKGDPAFRVYYQDSPTDPEFGYVPSALLPDPATSAFGADLAILNGGAFDQVRDNPSGIVGNTNARFVLFGHWENFFRRPSKPMESLFTIDLGDLRDRMNGIRLAGGRPWRGEYWFATPGSLFVFARASASERGPASPRP